MLAQQLVNGLMLGAAYSLVAIGYSLVFGVLKLIHLAHGEVFMIGAFIGLQLVVLFKAGTVTALIGSILGAALIGVILELVAHTRYGMAMRAVSENTLTASILGINVNNVILLTFAVASALGGVAGVLLGLSFNSVSPFMGIDVGIKGMAIMLIGGLGNIYGAMLGGVLLGAVEVLSVAYLASSYRDAFAFGLMILVLLFRPQGLFGSSYHVEGKA